MWARGILRVMVLARRVYTYARAEKYLAWCGMPESTPRARPIRVDALSVQRALRVPLLLGTISNWPQALPSREVESERGTRIRAHTPAEKKRSGTNVAVAAERRCPRLHAACVMRDALDDNLRNCINANDET